MTVSQNKLPQHVAVIMDGNGRWAKQRNLPRVAGHKVGADRVKDLVQLCLAQNISVLSLFAFSSENWLRPKEEVSYLMKLFVSSLNKELNNLHKNNVCLRFIGDKDAFNSVLRDKMEHAQTLTAKNTALILNIVVNYGGKWDIVEACKKVAAKVENKELAISDINESLFGTMLSTANLPEPDLFIRTGGEKRVSNFLLWQLAYSELYFSDIAWPDFTKTEFECALDWFASRERRFGKISEQIRE